MKKQLCMAGIIAVCFMLMGCGHEHTWAEATCTEPKTCSECSKTEGEALGHTWVEATCAKPKTCSICSETEGETLAHTWVDATCAEAKHCSVCGEIEGEPLEHTLTEANYQQPAICEVCGETVGEPLQADFEKYGLVCSAEQNTEYIFSELRDGENGNREIIGGGHFIFSDYEVFDSDDTHEALEGYEWRAITVTLSFNTVEANIFNNKEVLPIPTVTDYYCDFANTYNESTDTYTMNYNGEDYTDVKFDGDILQNDWNGDIYTFQGRLLCRVPKGYDGLVATVVDISKLDEREKLTVTDQAYYRNEFFRLK